MDAFFFKCRQTKNEKVNDSGCYTLMRIRGLGDKTEEGTGGSLGMGIAVLKNGASLRG